jgi:F-type H+-transporting ATPase subunit delta
VATNEQAVEGVAGRYASALFDLASESSAVAEVEANLNAFQAMLNDSPDLTRLVRSPVIAADDQAKALSAVLDKAGIGGLAGNFLKLLARNRRLFAVTDMIPAYRALAARARGEVMAEVTSASALTEAQLSDLKATLKAAVGKDVTLNTRVDPALLGGLVVKLGSRMIDSSIKTKLQSLKVALGGSPA